MSLTTEDLQKIKELFTGNFESIDRRFDDIDLKFINIDKKFEDIDNRFEDIDNRFKDMDNRFESIDNRFEDMDNRFESMDKKFQSVDSNFTSIDRRFDKIEIILLDMNKRLGKVEKLAEYNAELLVNTIERFGGNIENHEKRIKVIENIVDFRIN